MFKTMMRQVVFAMLALALFCGPAHALKFHLSEPADHPDKIDVAAKPGGAKGIPTGAPKDDSGAKPPAGDDAQSQDPKSAADSAPDPKTLGDGKYNGVYSAWQPLSHALPLKSAKLELGVVSHKDRKQWRNVLSRSAFTGNYYMEGQESDVLLDKFNWKVQHNRQLKSKPVSNSLLALSGGAGNVSLQFQQKETRTGAAAPSAAQNRSHSRTFNVDYKHSDTLAFSLKTDSQLHRSTGAKPADSKTDKYNWSANYRFAAESELRLTHTDTTSRDLTNSKTTRNMKTDVTLTMPLSGPFGMRLGYEHADNTKNDSGQSSDNNTRTASLSLIYQIQDNSQLTWTLSQSNRKDLTSTTSTDYDVSGHEIDLHYIFSSDLSLTSQNIIKDDDAHGQYSHHQATVAFDHKDFRLLPGKTTLTTKKTINRAGGDSQQATTENYTLNIPLSYLGGRLTAKALFNTSENRNHTAASSRDTDAANHTYNVTYSILPNLKASSEAKSVESESATQAGLASLTSNSIYTHKLSYDIKTPFSHLPSVTGFKYDLKTSRSRASTFAPMARLTFSKVTAHTGAFSLAHDNYTGSYQFENSNARQPHGISTRSLKHRLQLKVANVMGLQLTTDYSAIFQSSGFSNSGIFKLSRNVDENNVFNFTWEFSRNQDKNNPANNKHSKYVEASLDLNF